VTRVINYRLLSLLGVVFGTTALFLGLFFVWFVAPVAAIAVFYLAFFVNEERGGVGKSRRQSRRLRRQRLSGEAQARRADLSRAEVSRPRRARRPHE
jgi:hypothetical protein